MLLRTLDEPSESQTGDRKVMELIANSNRSPIATAYNYFKTLCTPFIGMNVLNLSPQGFRVPGRFAFDNLLQHFCITKQKSGRYFFFGRPDGSGPSVR